MTDMTSTPQQPFSGGSGGTAGAGPDLSPDPVPVTAPSVKAKSKSSRAINILLGLAVAVAIGGVAFAIGRGTAPAADQAGAFPRGGQFFNNGNGPNANGNGPTQGGPGAFAAGGLTVEGTVTAVSADSVTIKTAGGQEITVSTTGDTTYHQQEAATSNDVSTGSNVLVRLDGFRGRFGGGGPGASPAPSGSPETTAADITVVP